MRSAYSASVTAVIYDTKNNIETPRQFLALALAALDQAGIPQRLQNKIEAMVVDEFYEEEKKNT